MISEITSFFLILFFNKSPQNPLGILCSHWDTNFKITSQFISERDIATPGWFCRIIFLMYPRSNTAGIVAMCPRGKLKKMPRMNVAQASRVHRVLFLNVPRLLHKANPSISLWPFSQWTRELTLHANGTRNFLFYPGHLPTDLFVKFFQDLFSMHTAGSPCANRDRIPTSDNRIGDLSDSTCSRIAGLPGRVSVGSGILLDVVQGLVGLSHLVRFPLVSRSWHNRFNPNPL